MTEQNSSLPTTRLSHIIFVALSVFCLLIAFVLLDTNEAENAFIEMGYANLVVLLTCFVWALSKHVSKTSFNQWQNREVLLLLITCAIGAAFLYTREGGGFKIGFDEQVTANVAQNLYMFHLPVMRESSFSGIASLEMIDKRPLLFPVLASFVHSIFGYRVENIFYFNYTLTALFLFLLAKVTQRVAGVKASYFAVALACCMPLISQNASGGGFEILNLCLILTVSWFAMNFWSAPNDRNLCGMAISAALASHVRYESVLIVVPVAVLVISDWIRNRRIRIPWPLFVVPISYLPLVWQFRAIASNPERFQYKTDGSGSFSFDYFTQNVSSAYRFFFIPDLSYAGSPFIGFLGFIGILFLLVFSITRWKTMYQGRPERVALLSMVLFMFSQVLIVLCFFYGQLEKVIVSRLSLPFVLLLILAGGILLGLLHDWKKTGKAGSYILLGLTALYAFKMHASTKYTNSSTMNTRIEWALDFADSQGTGNYLYISNMPRCFEIRGYNNLITSRARTVLDRIKNHLDFMTYKEIFVIQNGKIELIDGVYEKSLLPYNSLGPAVTLETIDEVSLIAHTFSRLSRIVDIDLALDESPANETSSANGAQFRILNREESHAWSQSLP